MFFYFMKKFLTLLLPIFALGCSSGSNVNHQLNEDIAIKKQEMSQEQKIFQLENDSLGAEYVNWEKSIKKKFPAQDPIIQAHQKSIKAYQEIFQEHQNRLLSFKDSLEVFTKTLEKHSLGQASDNELSRVYKGMELRYNILQEKHQNLLENHQTFRDAYDALVDSYIKEEN